MKNYKISVIGKVQGVWFRKCTQEKASQLGLVGYVMNKIDGSVYIEVTGKEEVLTNFVNWLKTKGSPLSKVSKVNLEETEIEYPFTSFEIKR